MDHTAHAIAHRLDQLAGALDETRAAVARALDTNADDTASLSDRLVSLSTVTDAILWLPHDLNLDRLMRLKHSLADEPAAQR